MAARSRQGVGGGRDSLICADCGRPLEGMGERPPRGLRWNDGLMAAFAVVVVVVSITLITTLERLDPAGMGQPTTEEPAFR
ncbi:hypothetical protein [Synechococcus sp. CBW1006]|uniref:hypothetical protein n=1 Tax=Synechococcus sp. CBW1006 TaxID=1353138 RepID=UPI0018CDD013|nr:hypothetical protein [Synechococcus sp. CBW1006]QPN65422.1 hypothetical protein H8F26_10465 [Synechococcus sp. CBW1006]